IRIEGRWMLVADMDIAAAGIGLPDLDQCIRHAAAVFVDHMAMHDDALPERLAGMLPREIGVAVAHGLVAVDRPGQFRQRVAHRDQRLVRPALDRTLVARRQWQRMGLVTLGGRREGHCSTPQGASSLRGAKRRSNPPFRRHGLLRSARNGGYRRQFSFSMATATPCPTPTHMVASARLPPRFSMPCTAVSASRAPLIPSGWPSAIAPPCGLTKSASSLTPSCRRQAIPCEAKASLSSIKSKSLILMPRRSISLRVAGTGPMPIMRGGTA